MYLLSVEFCLHTMWLCSVVVFFKAIGDAPILKQSKFKIGGVEKFAKVIEFLRKQVHRETLVSENLSHIQLHTIHVFSVIHMENSDGIVFTCCRMNTEHLQS
jgi:hypothetical protein